jgi:ABC-type multidrug transport system fused ATPase/permease subunit
LAMNRYITPHYSPSNHFVHRPEFRQLVIGAMASAVIGVINPLQSLFFAQIFTSYYLPSNEVMDHLRPYLLVYVGLAVVMQISYVIQGYFFGFAGQKLVYRCRYCLLLSLLFSLSINSSNADKNRLRQYYNKIPSGSILSKTLLEY